MSSTKIPNLKIHHDDYFNLWTGNDGYICGVGPSKETKNPMPYNLSNGMFAIANLEKPIENHDWHILVLHCNTWLEVGDEVVRKYGGVNLVRIYELNSPSHFIYPSIDTGGEN